MSSRGQSYAWYSACLQQTVYWKHLALFLFINKVQTYFGFLHICSLFEIARGCFNGDVLAQRLLATARSSQRHSSSPFRPRRSAGRKPGKDSGSYCRPQDLLFLQAFLQAGFSADAEALAESNLKGFANTSMVLIETNIHQSALRSESTSSEKNHIPPAAWDTVPWQKCRSGNSPLAAASAARAPCAVGQAPSTQPHPPAQGFLDEDLAPAAESWCGCSQSLPKFPGYSRPAVVFGYFRYIAEAQLFQGLYGDG